MAVSRKKARCSCKCSLMCPGSLCRCRPRLRCRPGVRPCSGPWPRAEKRGGFGAIAEAAKALRPPTGSTYTPEPKATAIYGEVYGIWKDLHDTLGRAQPTWLHELKRLKLLAGPA